MAYRKISDFLKLCEAKERNTFATQHLKQRCIYCDQSITESCLSSLSPNQRAFLGPQALLTQKYSTSSFKRGFGSLVVLDLRSVIYGRHLESRFSARRLFWDCWGSTYKTFCVPDVLYFLEDWSSISLLTFYHQNIFILILH